MRRALTVSRMPLRVRVVAAVVLATAALLVVASLGLYLALGATLRSGIDDALSTRAADVAALAAESRDEPAARSPLEERGETIAQVLDPTGAVVDTSPALRGVRLLGARELRDARSGPVLLDRPAPKPVDPDERIRVLARPADAEGRPVVVVVGASLEPVENAQHRLAKLLLVGGPVLLLLISAIGYAAAAGALRPMERMRREAAEIRSARSGRRLDVPAADDEVSRLSVTLNDLLDRLETASRRERAFVDDASHEMRTPLALVKGELELAARPDAGLDEMRASIVSAAEENDRLVRLAEDLLVLARVDDGAVTHGEPVPVDDLADRVEAQAASSGLAFSRAADVAGEATVVHGDPRRLQRALLNVVRNARDAGATSVAFEARGTPASVELHVLDDGPGFPEAFLSTAFERFARADDARTRGGAGLGLAIVRSIAEAHGGSAGARNRPEGGADVWIVLPRTDPGGAPLSSRTHRRPGG